MSKKKLTKLEKELLKVEWKPIVINDKSTNYEISNDGLVKNVKNHTVLKTRVTIYGYSDVKIMIDNKSHRKRVHRLVAEAFVPNPDMKPQVNHKDGNKLNNHFTNLEWVTNAENIRHAVSTGLLINDGVNNPNNVYTEEQIHHVCKLLEDPKIKARDISFTTGVSLSIVNDISTRRSWVRISSQYNIPSNRIRYGELIYGNRHTKDQIHQVCKMLEDPRAKAEDISSVTGVSSSAVHGISLGKTWRHISSKYEFPEKRKPKRIKVISDRVKETINWIQNGIEDEVIVKRLQAEFDMPDRKKAKQFISDVKRNYKDLLSGSTTIPKGSTATSNAKH